MQEIEINDYKVMKWYDNDKAKGIWCKIINLILIT